MVTLEDLSLALGSIGPLSGNAKPVQDTAMLLGGSLPTIKYEYEYEEYELRTAK